MGVAAALAWAMVVGTGTTTGEVGPWVEFLEGDVAEEVGLEAGPVVAEAGWV